MSLLLRCLRIPGAGADVPAAERWFRLRAVAVALAYLIPLAYLTMAFSGFVRDFQSKWLWAYFTAGGILIMCGATARWGLHRLGRRVRAARGAVCPGCGYATDGLGDEFVCPECGRRCSQVKAREAWCRIGLL